MTLTGTKLAAAAAPLGIASADLVEADKTEAAAQQDERLFLRVERDGSSLSGLTDPANQALLAALDTDLKGLGYLAVLLGPDVIFGVGDPPSRPLMDLAAFVGALAAQRQTVYTVEVLVDKTAVAARLAGKVVGRDRRLYLFDEAVTGILAEGSGKAVALWAEPAEPIVIAILDETEIEAEGDLLRIVAGAKVTSETLASLPAGRDTARISAQRNEHIAWAANWSPGVTPFHYQVEFTTGADSTVAKALAAQMAKLATLHVCDRARIAHSDEPTKITADFRGGTHAASVEFDDRNTTRSWNNAEIRSLAELVEWVYRAPTEGARDWLFDRLQFAQITIARMLEITQSAYTGGAGLDEFVRIGNGLARRLEHQWETYVEGKLDDYAAKVAEVEQEAANVVSKYNERVAAIVKSVAETALAAVGVMVGTFIAAAFNTPFNRELFEIGLTVYAGYIIVFPLLWGQASHFYQMRQVTRVHNDRLDHLRVILGAAIDDNAVVRTAQSSGTKFWIWWTLALLVYFGLAGAAVVAVKKIPDALVKEAVDQTAWIAGPRRAHASAAWPESQVLHIQAPVLRGPTLPAPEI